MFSDYKVLIPKDRVDDRELVDAFVTEALQDTNPYPLEGCDYEILEQIYQIGVRPKSGVANDPDSLYSAEEHNYAIINEVMPGLLPKDGTKRNPPRTLFEWVTERLQIDLKTMSISSEKQFLPFLGMLNDEVDDAETRINELGAKYNLTPEMVCSKDFSQRFYKMSSPERAYFAALLNRDVFRWLEDMLFEIYSQWYPENTASTKVEEKPKEVKVEQFEFTATNGKKIKISYRPGGGVKVSDPKAFEGHLKKAVDLLEISAREVDNGKLYESAGQLILEAQKGCILKHPGYKSIAMSEGVYEIAIEKERKEEKHKEDPVDKKNSILAWLKTLILWVMGISVCLVFLLTPKKYIAIRYYGRVDVYDNIDYNSYAKFANPALRWEIIIPLTVVILIIGGLLIYTLRDKKK